MKAAFVRGQEVVALFGKVESSHHGRDIRNQREGHPEAAAGAGQASEADVAPYRHPHLDGGWSGECSPARLSHGMQHVPDLLVEPAPVEALRSSCRSA